MLRKIAMSIVLSLPVLVMAADSVQIKSDYPDKYIVEKGDTLWDISARFLMQPWLWPDIWKGNPQIENPHLIYPGDIVYLSYVDGKPFLNVETGAGGQKQIVSGRNVKLIPSTRAFERDSAIPAIPIDAIKHFLSHPKLVQQEQMESLPYIVSSYEEHLVASTGNKVYVRGLEDENTTTYSLYRQGEPYVSTKMEDGEEVEIVLGHEALYIGQVEVQKFGDPASAIVTSVNREIKKGDRLIPVRENQSRGDIIPQVPYREVDGQVISVVDGVTEAGQYQVLVLNVGENDGLESGNVLGVYQKGPVVADEIASLIEAKKEDERRIDIDEGQNNALALAIEDVANGIRDAKRSFDRTALAGYMGRPQSKPQMVTLPDEYAGVILIFKTYEQLSYALVMENSAPIHIKDSVKNL